MKKLIFFMMLFSFVIIGLCSAIPQPYAVYHFDNSITSAVNSSLSKYGGGVAESYVLGKFNNATYLPANSRLINTSFPDLDNYNNGYAFFGWFKKNVSCSDANGMCQPIRIMQNGAGGNTFFGIENDGQFTISFADGAGDSYYTNQAFGTFIDNNWHSFALKHNATKNEFYLDGLVKLSNNIAHATANSDTKFVIGGSYTVTEYWFNGYQDETMIFLVELSNQDILNLNTTTYPFLPSDTAPSVAFINKTPSDINITSYGINRIYYNITYDSGINSTYFTYKVNDSSGIINNYVNGSAYALHANKSFINISNIYSVNVFDNDIFPAAYNYNESVMETSAKNQINLTTVNTIAKIEFLDVPVNKNYYVAECYISNSLVGLGSPAQIYVANTSYSLGNPVTDPNVFLISTLAVNTPYNHNHSNTSRHYIFPFTNSTIKNPSMLLIKGASSQTYYLNYLPLQMRNNTFISTDAGTSYTNVPGTPDCHIHYYNSKDTFCFQASAIDSALQKTTSEFICDTLDITLQPPTSPSVYQPNSTGGYNGNINVNWTASVAFFPSVITMYSIDLYDDAGNYEQHITNTTALSTIFNSVGITTGNYTIRVTAFDNNSLSNYGISESFYIDYTKPMIISDSPSNLFSNLTSFRKLSEHDFNLTFSDVDLYYYSFVLMYSNGSVFFNESAVTFQQIVEMSNSITMPNESQVCGQALAQDGHTLLDVKAELIKDVVLSKDNEIIDNDFKMTFSDAVTSVKLNYLNDKISIDAIYVDKITERKSIRIDARTDKKKVSFSRQYGNFIDIGDNWIDFLPYKTQIIEYPGYYEVYLNGVKGGDIKLQSIGIVNSINYDFCITLTDAPISPVVTDSLDTGRMLFLIFLILLYAFFIALTLILRIPMFWIISGVIGMIDAVGMYIVLPNVMNLNFIISFVVFLSGLFLFVIPLIRK